MDWDKDYCIWEHPTGFRFCVGDSVVFDHDKAVPIGKSSHQSRPRSWIMGCITKVDVTGLHSGYAAYECKFRVAEKAMSCYITKDGNEYVAWLYADPRHRLSDAIKQDVAYTICVTSLHILKLVPQPSETSWSQKPLGLEAIKHWCGSNMTATLTLSPA